MPISDINGRPLQHYTNFPNDEVLNIEFGAGKGHFGKKEFPNCYLTDLSIPEIPHFTLHPDDYENIDCHYLDYECNYFETNLNGKTFDNLIICNPFEYGFLGIGTAKDFLDRAGELLNDNGCVYIIGHSKNPWSKYRNIERYLDKLKASGELTYNMELTKETIDDQHDYSKYNFTHCDLKTTTEPNEKIIIKKLAS